MDQLKSYRILAKIGAGGMGEVYLAEHLRLGRKVAIKFLSPALSAHRQAVSRFFAEARAAAQLNSPGIVQVFDCDANPDGRAFIVMEYLEGETLADRLSRGPLTPDFRIIVDLGIQIALALAVAHGRGIIHRDLKPANIFLTGGPGERLTVKLLDFGIAKLTDESSPGAIRTLSGEIVGTPAYMSPEQCRGKGSVDGRSDLYSLGCVLFEMLCSRRVFGAVGVGEWISAHMNERPADPLTLVPGCPPGLAGLILATLEKDPDRRPATAAMVAEELARLVPVGVAHRLPTATLPPPPRSFRYRWVLLGLAAAAGAGGWWLLRGSLPPSGPVAPALAPPAPPTGPGEVAARPDARADTVELAPPAAAPQAAPAAPPSEQTRRPPRPPPERKRRLVTPERKRPAGPPEGYYRPVED